MNPEKGPRPDIIRLTENRDVIARKLEEYRSRHNRFGAPETQLDTIYKIAIAESLLETGEIEKSVIEENVSKSGVDFDHALFENAWGVIKDYVETGGKLLEGGTGLYGNKGSDPEEDDDGNGRIM